MICDGVSFTSTIVRPPCTDVPAPLGNSLSFDDLNNLSAIDERFQVLLPHPLFNPTESIGDVHRGAAFLFLLRDVIDDGIQLS